MSRALSLETVELIDALVGALAIARRARALVENLASEGDAEREEPSPHHNGALPTDAEAHDASLVMVLVGVVAAARKLDAALAGWRPRAAPPFARVGTAPRPRDLLR